MSFDKRRERVTRSLVSSEKLGLLHKNVETDLPCNAKDFSKVAAASTEAIGPEDQHQPEEGTTVDGLGYSSSVSSFAGNYLSHGTTPRASENYVDRSLKGSIDVAISAACKFINSCPDFVTLSSCSGRISLFLRPIRRNFSIKNCRLSTQSPCPRDKKSRDEGSRDEESRDKKFTGENNHDYRVADAGSYALSTSATSFDAFIRGHSNDTVLETRNSKPCFQPANSCVHPMQAFDGPMDGLSATLSSKSNRANDRWTSSKPQGDNEALKSQGKIIGLDVGNSVPSFDLGSDALLNLNSFPPMSLRLGAQEELTTDYVRGMQSQSLLIKSLGDPGLDKNAIPHTPSSIGKSRPKYEGRLLNVSHVPISSCYDFFSPKKWNVVHNPRKKEIIKAGRFGDENLHYKDGSRGVLKEGSFSLPDELSRRASTVGCSSSDARVAPSKQLTSVVIQRSSDASGCSPCSQQAWQPLDCPSTCSLSFPYMPVSYPSNYSVILKMEPVVLHVECRSLASAYKLLRISHKSGLMQSAISALGKRIIVAVRGSNVFEAPIFTVTDEDTSESTEALSPLLAYAEQLVYSLHNHPQADSLSILGNRNGKPDKKVKFVLDAAQLSYYIEVCNEKLLNNLASIERFESVLNKEINGAGTSKEKTVLKTVFETFEGERKPSEGKELDCFSGDFQSPKESVARCSIISKKNAANLCATNDAKKKLGGSKLVSSKFSVEKHNAVSFPEISRLNGHAEQSQVPLLEATVTHEGIEDVAGTECNNISKKMVKMDRTGKELALDEQISLDKRLNMSKISIPMAASSHLLEKKKSEVDAHPPLWDVLEWDIDPEAGMSVKSIEGLRGWGFAVAFADPFLCVFGGSVKSKRLGILRVFNTCTREWKTVTTHEDKESQAPPALVFASLISIGASYLALIGGRLGPNCPNSDIYLLHVGDWRWQLLDNSSETKPGFCGRWRHAACVGKSLFFSNFEESRNSKEDNEAVIYLHGGVKFAKPVNSDGILSDLWKIKIVLENSKRSHYTALKLCALSSRPGDILEPPMVHSHTLAYFAEKLFIIGGVMTPGSKSIGDGIGSQSYYNEGLITCVCFFDIKENCWSEACCLPSDYMFDRRADHVTGAVGYKKELTAAAKDSKARIAEDSEETMECTYSCVARAKHIQTYEKQSAPCPKLLTDCSDKLLENCTQNSFSYESSNTPTNALLHLDPDKKILCDSFKVSSTVSQALNSGNEYENLQKGIDDLKITQKSAKKSENEKMMQLLDISLFEARSFPMISASNSVSSLDSTSVSSSSSASASKDFKHEKHLRWKRFPAARSVHSSAVVEREGTVGVFILGGFDGWNIQSDIWFLELTNLKWRFIGCFPDGARRMMASVAIANDELFVVGGGLVCFSFGARFDESLRAKVNFQALNNESGGFDSSNIGRNDSSGSSCLGKDSSLSCSDTMFHSSRDMKIPTSSSFVGKFNKSSLFYLTVKQKKSVKAVKCWLEMNGCFDKSRKIFQVIEDDLWKAVYFKNFLYLEYSSESESPDKNIESDNFGRKDIVLRYLRSSCQEDGQGLTRAILLENDYHENSEEVLTKSDGKKGVFDSSSTGVYSSRLENSPPKIFPASASWHLIFSYDDEHDNGVLSNDSATIASEDAAHCSVSSKGPSSNPNRETNEDETAFFIPVLHEFFNQSISLPRPIVCACSLGSLIPVHQSSSTTGGELLFGEERSEAPNSSPAEDSKLQSLCSRNSVIQLLEVVDGFSESSPLEDMLHSSLEAQPGKRIDQKSLILRKLQDKLSKISSNLSLLGVPDLVSEKSLFPSRLPSSSISSQAKTRFNPILESFLGFSQVSIHISSQEVSSLSKKTQVCAANCDVDESSDVAAPCAHGALLKSDNISNMPQPELHSLCDISSPSSASSFVASSSTCKSIFSLCELSPSSEQLLFRKLSYLQSCLREILEKPEMITPSKYVRFGEIVLFPRTCYPLGFFEIFIEVFRSSKFLETMDAQPTPAKSFAMISSLFNEFCEELCAFFRAKTLGIRGEISGSFRESNVFVFYGDQKDAKIKENGVIYSFDITKSMFASGNATERIRIATLIASPSSRADNLVIVDLFCGIGYFCLPILMSHKRRKFSLKKIYAVDWNPAALQAFENSISLNKLDRGLIKMINKDCRLIQEEDIPRGVADQIILGLVPSSSIAWPMASRLLNKELGGVIHVHGVVKKQEAFSDLKPSKDEDLKQPPVLWAEDVRRHFLKLLNDKPKNEVNQVSWMVFIDHLEKVKSYAPGRYHYVVDLRCLPIASKSK